MQPVAIHQDTNDVIGQIPKPDDVRLQLAKTVRQACLLRSLLRLSQRTYSTARHSVAVHHG